MKDQKEMHFYIEPTEKGNVTFRQGDALPLREPHVISFTGELPSVANYLKKHGCTIAPKTSRDEAAKLNDDAIGYDANYVDPRLAIIIVDKKNLSIKLLTDPKSAYGHTIIGQLVESDELKKFAINQNKTYNREQMVKLLRFNAMYFTNKESHDKLLESFQKLNLSVSSSIGASSDNRGNKDVAFKKEVGNQLPKDFIISVPLFNGYDPVNILVELCVDVSESTAVFWFESVELAELQITKRDELIREQLEGVEDTYVVLYQ